MWNHSVPHKHDQPRREMEPARKTTSWIMESCWLHHSGWANKLYELQCNKIMLTALTAKHHSKIWVMQDKFWQTSRQKRPHVSDRWSISRQHLDRPTKWRSDATKGSTIVSGIKIRLSAQGGWKRKYPQPNREHTSVSPASVRRRDSRWSLHDSPYGCMM